MDFDLNAVLTDIKKEYQRLVQNNLYPASEDLSSFQDSKSNMDAVRFRNFGNKLYSSKDDFTALLLYTRSVAWAAEDSEELALAYANRSAVLFRLCKYDSCLLDVNRALAGQYPENLRPKLRERKRQCLIQRGLQASGDLLNSEATDRYDLANNDGGGSEWKAFCNFDNAVIPNASSKIKFEYAEESRKFVACKNIEPGKYSHSFSISYIFEPAAVFLIYQLVNL